MMRKTAFFAGLAVVLICVVRPATANVCEPPPQTTNASLPGFNDHVAFDVQVRPTPSGSDIRVTGDIIVIDEERLSSLVAPAGSAKTKIARLTFDGREVRVRGPISLQGGELHILGEKVRFERGGRISLLPPPASAQGTRSLRIVATTIEIEGGPKRPLNLYLSAGGNVAASIHAMKGPTSAELWRLFVDSLETEIQPPAVKTMVGAGAGSTVQRAFRDEASWPLFYAAKLRQHFARSPYAKQTMQEIDEIAARYQPLMVSWRGPIPVSITSAVRTAILRNADLVGKQRAFTPKQDLEQQETDTLKAIEQNRFPLLIDLIVDAAGNDSSLKAQLAANENKLSTAMQEQGRLRAKIGGLTTLLAQHAQRREAVDVAIAQRDRVLRLMQARDFKRLKDAQSVKQWTTVAAAVVVTAASMGAASPAVAAGVSAGLSMTGDTVYGHNTGQGLTLADVVKNGKQSYDAAIVFQAKWKDVSEANKQRASVFAGETVLNGPEPESGKPDKRQPMTKAEATFGHLAALGELAQAAAALNGDRVSAPTPLTLTERQNEDEEMKELVASRAAAHNDFTLVAAELKFDTAALESVTAKAAELEAVDYELRSAQARNDQEVMRWRAAALALWSQEVDLIGDLLATFRRSLYFETGLTPVGVPDVLDYPNELQSKIAGGVLDPFGGVGPTAAKDEVRSRLTIEMQKFIAAAKTTHSAITQTHKTYLQSRNEADVYRKEYPFSRSSANPIHRRFIETLNAQIAQQIVSSASIRSIQHAYVPIVLPETIANYPQRIVSARITGVEFDQPRASVGPTGLLFILLHPNFGEMRRGTECFPADLRTNAADWKIYTTPLEQVSSNWVHQEPARINIGGGRGDRFYTYLPARAPYHMLVNVDSSNWRSLPTIKSITIGLEVME